MKRFALILLLLTSNIYSETINGHILPPEPDTKINNSTLLGIDSNNNGVRDDVERWIYKTYDEYVPCHQELDYNNTVVIDGETIPSAIEVCEDNPVPYHPVVREIAMQGAKAAQIIIQEPEKARETREVFSSAYFCSFALSDFRDNQQRKLYENYMFGDEFKKIQFNTVQRARAFGKYNFYLSGGIYSQPTDDKKLQGCSSEVKELLKNLNKMHKGNP